MENNFRFASAAVSDRGLSDKRPVNEDSFIELGKYGLFAVADGVGGAQAGDFASQMAVEILGEAFSNMPENADAEIAMKDAVEKANLGIYNASNELPQLSSMATTLAALHISGNIATIGHVGDSRVYRIEPDGTLHRETSDHSVVEEEVRAGRITPEQALTHPNRNIISRALGAENTVDVDLKTIMVEPGTMFLICSDGITRHITDDEIAKVFSYEIEPAVICDRLKDICYQRGAEDNLTAIVVRIASELASTFAASQIAEAAVTTPDEAEEETVASSRPATETSEPAETPAEPAVTPAVAEQPVPVTEDLSHLAEELDDGAYLMEEEAAVPGDLTVYGSERVTVQAAEPQLQEYAPAQTAAVTSTLTSFEDHQASSRGGWFAKFLIGLLAGLLLGAGGYYLFDRSNVQPDVPVLNDTKGSNITMVVFEETRREVDSAPERFLAAKAASPQTPDDHYFLGRAQLLTGKYVEAQHQFALAKEKLGAADPANAKTLAADIAIGTAIANNPAVAEAFAKEVAGGGQPANANTNANSGAAPVR